MVSDVVGGLNVTLTRDGSTSPTADIDFASHKVTNLHSNTTTLSDLSDGDAINAKILKNNIIPYIDSSNVTQTAASPNLITLAFDTVIDATAVSYTHLTLPTTPYV